MEDWRQQLIDSFERTEVSRQPEAVDPGENVVAVIDGVGFSLSALITMAIDKKSKDKKIARLEEENELLRSRVSELETQIEQCSLEKVNFLQRDVDDLKVMHSKIEQTREKISAASKRLMTKAGQLKTQHELEMKNMDRIPTAYTDLETKIQVSNREHDFQMLRVELKLALLEDLLSL
jgi:FtsZ-binding cell division protein ZapB